MFNVFATNKLGLVAGLGLCGFGGLGGRFKQVETDLAVIFGASKIPENKSLSYCLPRK